MAIKVGNRHHSCKAERSQTLIAINERQMVWDLGAKLDKNLFDPVDFVSDLGKCRQFIIFGRVDHDGLRIGVVLEPFDDSNSPLAERKKGVLTGGLHH